MNRWSLVAKMFSVMSILVVAIIVCSYLGLTKMAEIKNSLNTIVHGSASRVGNAHEIKELFLIQIINEKNLILEEEASRAEIHLKRLSDRHQQILKSLEGAKKISTSEGVKDLEKFNGLYKQWWDVETEITRLVKEGKNKEAFTISREQGREIRLRVEELMDSIVERNEGFMLADTKEAENDYETARNFVLVFSICATLFGLSLASIVLRSVNLSINEVITILTEGSSQVLLAAQQTAASSEELSQSSAEQASSLEETASSIEEMNSMLQKSSESARRTSDLAIGSNVSAEKGKKVVKEMIDAIDDIHTSNKSIRAQIDESNQRISDIVKVISEIGSKTKVINDIVFQTKLLSFNASVEAARSGENGKGFAVVAEEVGNLARMSGSAAEEISKMLDESITKVEYIVTDNRNKISSLMIEGQSRIDVGGRIAQQCGLVLDEIVSNASGVRQMSDEISNACKEQSIGIDEIAKAIGQIDQVTQTNAVASEEVASSAEELSSQADSLKSGVNVLIRTIKGSGQQQEDRHPNVVSIKTAKVKTHAKPQKPSRVVDFDLRNIPSESDVRFKDV